MLKSSPAAVARCLAALQRFKLDSEDKEAITGLPAEVAHPLYQLDCLNIRPKACLDGSLGPVWQWLRGLDSQRSSLH